ncbi:bleomycin resistance protein [Legionella beliardensis]|uniref:Bleomycin resistance protein n=1 Tax=Legionella beliardensis TaxID=91822 RepID=A0A378I1A7_9GAMM|nr:VOC family protein [Legionella beliardensis]STX28510.1 bleomycin resistance protein [Legionella beliardensis]
MLEPSTIIIYVDDLAKSKSFYQSLLSIKPDTHSSTFIAFAFSNGMHLGLKDKQTVHPSPEGHGGGELAFTLANTQQVDELFLEWQQKGVTVSEPVYLPFGYTFVALDPDGNRLRVAALLHTMPS